MRDWGRKLVTLDSLRTLCCDGEEQIARGSEWVGEKRLCMGSDRACHCLVSEVQGESAKIGKMPFRMEACESEDGSRWRQDLGGLIRGLVKEFHL